MQAQVFLFPQPPKAPGLSLSQGSGGPGATPSPLPQNPGPGAGDKVPALGPGPFSRPIVRGDCENGPRPCPFISCRYHLAMDVRRVARIIRRGDEGAAVEAIMSLPVTCSLDCSEEPTPETDLADYLGISRQAIGQLTARALHKLRHPARLRVLRELEA